MLYKKYQFSVLKFPAWPLVYYPFYQHSLSIKTQIMDWGNELEYSFSFKILSHPKSCVYTFNQNHNFFFLFYIKLFIINEFISFHIIASCHFAKIYSTERAHQFTLIYAILGLLTENESRFLIKFLINANQIKLKYSLLTSSFIQCCNKDVIIYSGASVSEFIHAIC